MAVKMTIGSNPYLRGILNIAEKSDNDLDSKFQRDSEHGSKEANIKFKSKFEGILNMAEKVTIIQISNS